MEDIKDKLKQFLIEGKINEDFNDLLPEQIKEFVDDHESFIWDYLWNDKGYKYEYDND